MENISTMSVTEIDEKIKSLSDEIELLMAEKDNRRHNHFNAMVETAMTALRALHREFPNAKCNVCITGIGIVDIFSESDLFEYEEENFSII